MFLLPRLSSSQRKFTSAPTVLVSAEHERRDVKLDASSVWIEDVTTTSFKICVRELQNFDGAHESIHIVSCFVYSLCALFTTGVHFMLIWIPVSTVWWSNYLLYSTFLLKRHKFRQNRVLLKLQRMLFLIKMFLGFENLFCLQMYLDSFTLKITVRLYLFCFGLKITICLMWRMCDASTRKKILGLFFKLT